MKSKHLNEVVFSESIYIYIYIYIYIFWGDLEKYSCYCTRTAADASSYPIPGTARRDLQQSV